MHGKSQVLLSLNWIQHGDKLKVRVPTNYELCLAQTILRVQGACSLLMS